MAFDLKFGVYLGYQPVNASDARQLALNFSISKEEEPEFRRIFGFAEGAPMRFRLDLERGQQNNIRGRLVVDPSGNTFSDQDKRWYLSFGGALYETDLGPRCGLTSANYVMDADGKGVTFTLPETRRRGAMSRGEGVTRDKPRGLTPAFPRDPEPIAASQLRVPPAVPASPVLSPAQWVTGPILDVSEDLREMRKQLRQAIDASNRALELAAGLGVHLVFTVIDQAEGACPRLKVRTEEEFS